MVRRALRRALLLLPLLSLACAHDLYANCHRASVELCEIALACEPEFSFPGAGTYVCPAGYPEAIPGTQCAEALTYACIRAR